MASTKTTSYYLVRAEKAEHAIDSAINTGVISQDEGDLIRQFIQDCLSSGRISQHSANKIVFNLVGWRRFILRPYQDLSADDVRAGIEGMKTGKSLRGRPFKPSSITVNTNRLKQFLHWLIQKGYSSISEQELNGIDTPTMEQISRKEPDLLTREEIAGMVAACQKTIDKAMIMLLYEGGFRVGELITLTWKDLDFIDQAVSITVRSDMFRERYLRLVLSTSILTAWKIEYPGIRTPDAQVFVNKNGAPFTYPALLKRIKRVIGYAGIKKHVTLHLFRYSRIAHLIEDGMRESAIAVMMWGTSDTGMLRSFVHLDTDDIDTEVARIYGFPDPIAVPITCQVRPLPCVQDPAVIPSDINTPPNCDIFSNSASITTVAEASPYIVKDATDFEEYVDQKRNARMSSSS